jgi:hypothetical protein
MYNTGAESESDDGFYDFSGGDAAPQKRKHGMEEQKAFERGKVSGTSHQSSVVLPS